MKSSLQRGAVIGMAALFATLAVAGPASASESKSGNISCSNQINVSSKTTAFNGNFYVRHKVNTTPVTWYSGGAHSANFAIKSGTWEVYTSNGTLNNTGSARCV
ncbi:hypothetical protein [Modestobacter sp. Leaf380]|uniref:hypothetical protein n=1 Tax=Modestobacter sp. Leaf380 TaxID=1736356 RepID=UPI0012F72122|nr:hypothetical protein [Modestobacter sp. Leaf380]